MWCCRTREERRVRKESRETRRDATRGSENETHGVRVLSELGGTGSEDVGRVELREEGVGLASVGHEEHAVVSEEVEGGRRERNA